MNIFLHRWKTIRTKLKKKVDTKVKIAWSQVAGCRKSGLCCLRRECPGINGFVNLQLRHFYKKQIL